MTAACDEELAALDRSGSPATLLERVDDLSRFSRPRLTLALACRTRSHVAPARPLASPLFLDGLFLAVAFRGGLAFELGAGVELGAVDARWRR